MTYDLLLIVFGTICALLAAIEINAITDREKHRQFCQEYADRLEEANRAHIDALQQHRVVMAAHSEVMERMNQYRVWPDGTVQEAEETPYEDAARRKTQ